MKRTLIVAGLLLAGCSHVSHGAYVRPGFALGAELGARVERTAPPAGMSQDPGGPTQTYSDVQLSAGYGWRFESGRAASLRLVMPTRSVALTRLDVYLQGRSGPLDGGIGFLLGVGPEMYVEAGHRFKTAGLELSVGFRIPTITTFALLTTGTDAVRVGLWGEYQNPVGVDRRCDENCDAHDYVDYGISGGFTVTVHLGAPDAAPAEAPRAPAL